jgi:pyroglutamyl-peptidase
MGPGPVLVTGFEPYGGRGFNPAFDAMRALDGRAVGEAAIVGVSLPVAYGPLKSRIAAILDEINPRAVLSLGASPGESMIRLERIGVNVADFEIPDNEGALLRDVAISGNGPAARISSLPLRQIEDDLLAAGIPARISFTAGTFLCNACLYSFLESVEQRSRPVPCGFIHVPYTPEQVALLLREQRTGQKPEQRQRAELASMELSRIVRAVELAVDATVRSLVGLDSARAYEGMNSGA